MISIKPLLFPLAICLALLMPEYVLGCLDAWWGNAPIEALFYSALDDVAGGEVSPSACACFPCLIVAPAEGDASDDE